jgi:Icc protein
VSPVRARRQFGPLAAAVALAAALFVPGAAAAPPQTLRVLHLTDLHYDESPFAAERLARLEGIVRSRAPDLVLCTGDMMTTPREKGYTEIRAVFDRLPVPVIVVPGNHDHLDLPLFRRYFGPSRPGPETWTSFDRGAIHFVGLDSGESDGLFSHRGKGLGKSQMAWLAADLAGAGGKPTWIFLHHSPVLEADSFPEAAGEFARIIKDNGVRGVLSGHVHRDAVFDLSAGGGEVASFTGVRRPAIHTTTFGSDRLRGDYRGVRLIVLTAGEVDPATPFRSIPESSYLPASPER